MKDFDLRKILPTVLVIVAILLSSFSIMSVEQFRGVLQDATALLQSFDKIEAQGVTNFDRLALKSSTTSDVLSVNSTGAGTIASFEVNATPVWSVDYTGAVVQTGSPSIVGNMYVSGTIGAASAISSAVEFNAADGTAAAPAFSFTSDGDSGLYRIGTNNVGFAAGGALISDWSATGLDMNALIVENVGNAGTDFDSSGGLTLAAPLKGSAGAVGTPSLTFSGDPDTGFYNIGANNIGLAVGGTKMWDWNASGTSFAGQLNMPDGTAAAPILRFTDDTNTGFYRVTTDTIGFSAGGANIASIETTGLDVGGGFGSSGCTLSTAGVFQCDGAATLGSTIHVTGEADFEATALFEAAGDFRTQISNGGANHSGSLYIADSTEITGALDVQGGNITMQNDETLANSLNGTITATVAANGAFAINTGNLRVGNGTATQTLNGEDGYVEGLLEVDGKIYADGGISPSSVTPSAAGSAASAIYAMSSDVDTGLYYPGDNTIGMSAGSSLALQVDNTGVTIAEYAILTSQSVTPTNGDNITMTASLVNLTPAGPVTPTAAACTNGAWLVLYNANAQNILLQDSGNFVLTGDLTLGQYDTVQLMCIATKWTQIGPVSTN